MKTGNGPVLGPWEADFELTGKTTREMPNIRAHDALTVSIWSIWRKRRVKGDGDGHLLPL